MRILIKCPQCKSHVVTRKTLAKNYFLYNCDKLVRNEKGKYERCTYTGFVKEEDQVVLEGDV